MCGCGIFKRVFLGGCIECNPREWQTFGKDTCFDCGKEIVGSDDDAFICIDCGGRNRRITHEQNAAKTEAKDAWSVNRQGAQGRNS